MFEEKTFDTILDEMLSMIPDNVDRREGSMIYDALAPCAFRLAEAYAALTELSDALLPTKAKGDYLEALGALWNVRREPATYAKLYLKVTPTTRKISTGTRFRVGTYLYTVESAETEEGVWCICAEEAGTGPSVSSGTALPVTYVPGLQSAVVTGIKEAGKEKEDETHFRDRVLQAAVSVRFGGNKGDYVAYAKTFEEIAYARVQPAWEREDGKILLEVLKNDFEYPDEALITKIQNAICPDENGEGNGMAPIGHRVIVSAPELYICYCAVAYSPEQGANIQTVSSAIYDALKQHIMEKNKKWESGEIMTLIPQELANVVRGVDGVASVSSVNINSSMDSVQTNLLLFLQGVSYVQN